VPLCSFSRITQHTSACQRSTLHCVGETSMFKVLIHEAETRLSPAMQMSLLTVEGGEPMNKQNTMELAQSMADRTDGPEVRSCACLLRTYAGHALCARKKLARDSIYLSSINCVDSQQYAEIMILENVCVLCCHSRDHCARSKRFLLMPSMVDLASSLSCTTGHYKRHGRTKEKREIALKNEEVGL
jgi:hypothetical protein